MVWLLRKLPKSSTGFCPNGGKGNRLWSICRSGMGGKGGGGPMLMGGGVLMKGGGPPGGNGGGGME